MPRLQSGLPKGDANGLSAIARHLIDAPLDRHLVLAVVDCSKITTDTATGEQEATVRVLRIERVHPDDVTEAERLVRRALEYRHGDEVLPIDIERDLEEWFGKGFELDPETGALTEVTDDEDDGPTDTK